MKSLLSIFLIQFLYQSFCRNWSFTDLKNESCYSLFNLDNRFCCSWNPTDFGISMLWNRPPSHRRRTRKRYTTNSSMASLDLTQIVTGWLKTVSPSDNIPTCFSLRRPLFSSHFRFLRLRCLEWTLRWQPSSFGFDGWDDSNSEAWWVVKQLEDKVILRQSVILWIV